MRNVKRPALEGTSPCVTTAGSASPSTAHPRPGDRLDARHPGRAPADPAGGPGLRRGARLRIIGIDRPGIGSSTPYLYPTSSTGPADLALLLDTLAIDTVRIDRAVRRGPVRAGRRRRAARPGPRRRRARGGGADPWRRRAEGGVIQLAVRLAPLLVAARVPLGVALTGAIRLVRPLAGPGLDLYAAVQPPGDKNLLSRPEFKAMFLDDLLNGSRFQTSAPLTDLVLFTRDWGFAPRRRRCRCGGGTATRTTSCRSRTASTWSTGCRTPR